MEEKVTLSLIEFKTMYKENIDNENYISELKRELENQKEEYKSIKKYICNQIFDLNQYDLKNIENLTIDDYHFRNLIGEFRKCGYRNFDEITYEIKKMKLQFDSEENVNEK